MSGSTPRMPISSLGYVEIAAENIDEWETFATDILGMQVAERSNDLLRLKMDVWQHRITVRKSAKSGITALGWELKDIRDVQAVVDALSREGCEIQIEDDTAGSRGVAYLAATKDPAGNRMELFVGARTEETRKFMSPTGVQFVTGPLGVGHVTVATSRYEEMFDFYSRVLGFYVSDFLVGDLQAAFMSPNPRHHSIAIIDTHGTVDAYDHLMVEVDDLASVGRAYDKILEVGAPLTYSLGKHWNDHMTSFYVESPSGFDMEYGWNGRTIDRQSWAPVQGNGEISIWGHHATSRNLAQKRGAATWLRSVELQRDTQAK